MIYGEFITCDRAFYPDFPNYLFLFLFILFLEKELKEPTIEREFWRKGLIWNWKYDFIRL